MKWFLLLVLSTTVSVFAHIDESFEAPLHEPAEVSPAEAADMNLAEVTANDEIDKVIDEDAQYNDEIAEGTAYPDELSDSRDFYREEKQTDYEDWE